MRKMRILIVDDSNHVRHGVRSILESQAGWEVCGEAGSGPEAVVQSECLDPDIVVLDISMPGMNGLETIPHIRNIAPRSKVLFLSVHQSSHVVRKAREAGALGYVFKSDLDRDLLTAVERAAQNQEFYPPELAEMAANSGFRGTRVAKDEIKARELSENPLASEGGLGGQDPPAKPDE